MDETAKKIRLGLILQGCVEEALKQSTFSKFIADSKYDDNLMKPDVIIPDDRNPTHFIEVTQTEARNSFQRKTPRYFEAVCEAKIHFGPEVISINVLMGDPENELPASNVQAMCSFFDANLIPRNDCQNSDEKFLLDELERDALIYASDDSFSSAQAINKLKQTRGDAIKILSDMLNTTISAASVNKTLIPLWEMERSRVEKLKDLDKPLSDIPAYKRPILESLFLSDAEFAQLRATRQLNLLPLPLLRQIAGKKLLKLNRKDQKVLNNVMSIAEDDFVTAAKTPNPIKLSKDIQKRLFDVGLLEIRQGVSYGNKKIQQPKYTNVFRRLLFECQSLSLKNDLSALLDDPFGAELRQRCKSEFEKSSALKAFFEDIRNEHRRLAMVSNFLSRLELDVEQLKIDILRNLKQDTFLEIHHPLRCWFIDLLAMYIDVSHNQMNGWLVTSGNDAQNLGNPFNQMSYKSARFMSKPDTHKQYASAVIETYTNLLPSRIDNLPVSEYHLATRLLQHRMFGAISMQKFNPLHLLITSVCKEMGFSIRYESASNLLSDLASNIKALGKFKVFKIGTPNGTILVNTLYVDSYGGLDKGKEWSARGRSFPYRFQNNQLTHSNLQGMILVADGAWKTEALRKLRMGGWHICRPANFQDELRLLTGGST